MLFNALTYYDCLNHSHGFCRTAGIASANHAVTWFASAIKNHASTYVCLML